MKRIKLTEVLLTIPVEHDGDDYDLEIEDELFDMFELSAACLAKASQEIQAAAAEVLEHPCSLTVIDGNWEDMSLEQLRERPQRTRARH